MADNEILTKVYSDMYYHSLRDREIIQSKIRLFLYLSIASLSLAYFLMSQPNSALSCLNIVSTLYVFIVILLHVLIFYFLINVFVMQDYDELPLPEGIEIRRKALLEKGKQLDAEEMVMGYYSDAASHNSQLNEKRRDKLSNLTVLYFIIGGFTFFWFIFYSIALCVSKSI